MAKYCSVYRILCVCPTCDGDLCAQSPRTKGEAEIARSCKLDVDGKVIEADKPTMAPPSRPSGPKGFSEARNIKLPQTMPPEEETAGYSPLIIGGAVAALILSVSGGLMLFFALSSEPDLLEIADLEEISEAVEEEEEIVEEEPSRLETADESRREYVFRPPPITFDDAGPTLPRRQIFAPPPRFTELKVSGNERVQQGDYQGARELYLQAIAEAPEHHEGYTNLANTFTDQGNHLAAEPIYMESLRIDPSSVTTRFNLANSYLRAGRWADAEREFITVLEAEPRDWEARLLLGIAQYRQEKWQESIVSFQTVLAISPRSAYAHYNLHLAYSKMGAPHLARTYLHEAFRLDPTLRDRG
ncbi:MAG: tetratricopeptide repeat protein [Candidatus Sumerlaeia bacterium]|nr:tetratricopeptide repeat protein [Candidatus Sumerlaeia bacterium]